LGSLILYRLQFVGHRIEPYAAALTGGSCLFRNARSAGRRSSIVSK
jgi:hypothetical protein